MQIQVIRYFKNSSNTDEMTISPLNAPRALDDFDINIIDLSVEAMWAYSGDEIGMIDSLQDLHTIQKMVCNKKRAIVVYVLPQNIKYKTNTRLTHYTIHALKNILYSIQNDTIRAVVPLTLTIPEITYEKTETTISGQKFDADFCFINPRKVITLSDKSEKPTTIELSSKVYATTLCITKTTMDLNHFISSVFAQSEKSSAPPWMDTIYFGDDREQELTITKSEEKIEEEKNKIIIAQTKLDENSEIKSILYTNGEHLVSVVFKILERLLDYDLSTFLDKKREDFLIKLPQCTFIGEIKGVTSNVKYEHITQLELHYREYLDKLYETGDKENVKQLLVINPFRTKPIEQREPVCTAQIDLAKRNECLIIETNTLLRIYEKFCANYLTSQQCQTIFANRTGLLSLSDFDEIEENL